MSKYIINGGKSLAGDVIINGAKNAAILATTILATGNEALYQKLCDYKESLKDAVIKKDEKLQSLGYQAYIDQM